ncbi:MAG TPA: zinc-ribbon domain-containing protein [Bryobacteraceae bacterium]|jgi:uncharacterized membrane protein|nr:zinc-ribbon domain-containing protein [Bryobacteraceae bacterium]
MPFCPQCGNRVGDADIFCGKCGTRQPTGAPPGNVPRPDLTAGISDRNAALLCYIPMVGWIAAIVVLASERFRRDPDTRFHAFQGLYLFVAWLMVEWVVSPALYFSDWRGGFPMHRLFTHLLQLLVFAAWIFMIIKASHGEKYKLPIVGELAERSVSEQRS